MGPVKVSKSVSIRRSMSVNAFAVIKSMVELCFFFFWVLLKMSVGNGILPLGPMAEGTGQTF